MIYILLILIFIIFNINLLLNFKLNLIFVIYIILILYIYIIYFLYKKNFARNVCGGPHMWHDGGVCVACGGRRGVIRDMEQQINFV